MNCDRTKLRDKMSDKWNMSSSSQVTWRNRDLSFVIYEIDITFANGPFYYFVCNIFCYAVENVIRVISEKTTRSGSIHHELDLPEFIHLIKCTCMYVPSFGTQVFRNFV